MTNEDSSQEWSCGTCTFINRPLFLACDMCGSPKPSQGPTPPRRQPSFEPEFDPEFDPAVDDESSIDSIVHDLMIENNFHVSSSNTMNHSSGIDRAPRRVERHRSISPQFGTLIMTDDPANYERQDGKKPGELLELEHEDPEEQELQFRRSRRLHGATESPSVDDEDLSEDSSSSDGSYSEDEEDANDMEVSLNHLQVFEEPHRHRDTHMRRPVRTNSGDSQAQERYDHLRPLPEVPRSPTSSRRQLLRGQHNCLSSSSLPRDSFARRPSHGTLSTATNGPKSVSKFGHGSLNTLPTQLMGSSSNRLSYDGYGMDGSMDDGSYVSSLESGSRASGTHPHHRMSQQQRNHVQILPPREYMDSRSNSRRNVMSQSAPHHLLSHGYASQASQSGSRQTPQYSHQRRHEGLPVVLPRETASRGRGTYSNFPNSSSRRLLSADHSVVTSPPCACGSSEGGSSNSGRKSAATLPQQLQQQPPKRESLRRNSQLPSLRSMAQGESSRSFAVAEAAAAGGDFIESVLPSIAPPPVPILDSPTDVNVMAVFQKDRVAERRRLAANAARAKLPPNNDSIHQATVRGRKLARAAMLDSVAKGGAFAGSSSLGGCSSLSSATTASESSRNLRASNFYAQETGAHPFAAAVEPPVVAEEPPKRGKGGKRRLKGGIRAVMASMRITAKN